MYSITNLAFTRDDPNRRYLKSPLARTARVIIGPVKVPPGRTITISDATYQQFVRRIHTYETSGLIRVTQLAAHPPNSQPIVLEPVEMEADVQEVVEAASFAESAVAIAVENEVAAAVENEVATACCCQEFVTTGEHNPGCAEVRQTAPDVPVADVPVAALDIQQATPLLDDDEPVVTKPRGRKARAPKETA